MVSITGTLPVRFAWLVLIGCSASQQPAAGARAQPGPSAPAATSESAFATGLARVEVRSQAVTLVLPDSSAWRGETAGTWSVLRHDATASTLYLKHWRAARLVRPDECLLQARLGQPAMIILRDEEIIERRRVTAPPGFVGEVVVGVREVGSELRGYAELSSAGIGRCHVAAFHTATQGKGREQELGRRLAIIVENAFERARTRAVEDRVTR